MLCGMLLNLCLTCDGAGDVHCLTDGVVCEVQLLSTIVLFKVLK